MTPFKHILVSTDFGEPAARALECALTLASTFGSKLTLVHASWFPPAAYGGYVDGLIWPIAEMANGAKLELDAAVSKAKELYPNTEGVIVTCEPWQGILEVAENRNADLIVMGTHGRRGLSRMFLGSVAEKVVRLSPIPVLTISGKAEREAKERVLARMSGERPLRDIA